MESISTTQLGETLLANAPAELRATVLAGACKDLHSAVKRVSAKPTTIKRYDIDSALLVIREIRDGDVLAKIARSDTRVNVQTALASHEIKVEMAGRNTQTGGKKKTAELLEGTVEEVLVNLADADRRTDWNQVLDWARNLTGNDKANAYTSLIRGGTSIRGLLLVDVQRNQVPGTTFQTFLGANETSNDSYRRRRLVGELVSAWTGEYDTSIAELAVENKVPLRSHNVTRDAALILASSKEHNHIATAVESGKLTTAEIVGLFEKADARLQGSLINSAPDAETAEALASRIEYDGTTGLGYGDPTRLLSKWAELSTQARANVLRYASGREVHSWAAGKFVAIPREGEGRIVAKQILEKKNYSSVGEVISAFNREASLGVGVVTEMWETFYQEGRGLARQLLMGGREGKLTEDVVARLVATFGDDTAAWEMLATVLPEWNGTIPELIETVQMVTV